jgi:hypothetical protein
MKKNTSKGQILIPFARSSCKLLTRLVGLPEGSGKRISCFPLSTSLKYITWEINNRTGDRRSSET